MPGYCLSRIRLLVLSLLLLLYFHPAETAVSSQRRSAAQRDIAPRENDERDKFWKFVTRPDIKAPRWRINVFDEQAISPGYWFLAPYQDLDQVVRGDDWVGPHIYDSNGDLVWSGVPTFKGWNTFDFRLANTGAEDMLTLLVLHEGVGIIMDSSYRIHETVNITEHGDVDMHEFNVIESGTRALVINKEMSKPTVDASHQIGFDGGVCSTTFQGFRELEANSSEALFRWSAQDHIGLDESTYVDGTVEEMCNGEKGNWDSFHFNGIDKFPDGDYILSSRHTDTIYKISHEDGHIVWRLGGVKSDFPMGDAKFSRQHHARVRGQNETHTLISLFDNAKGTGPEQLNHPTNSESRALLLAVQTEPEKKVEIVAKYTHPMGWFSNSRGSYQELPNGHVFLCWTYNSLLTEHHADGRLIFEAHFTHPAHSYRIYKYPWVGHPTEPPEIYARAVSTGDSPNDTLHTMTYVSWNGATEVASWNLYKADRGGNATELVASVLRQGFETAITHEGYATYVVAEALDRNGEPLGRSRIFETIPPENKFDPSVVNEAHWLQEHEAGFREATAFFSNPFVAVFIGVEIGVIVFGLFWALWCSKHKMVGWWRRRKGPLYESLSSTGKEEGVLEKEWEVEDEQDLDEGQERVNERSAKATVRVVDHGG